VEILIECMPGKGYRSSTSKPVKTVKITGNKTS
jgi:hypothetical protein